MIQKNSLVHFKYNVEKNDYSQPYRVVKTWVWSPHVNARLEQIENVKSNLYSYTSYSINKSFEFILLDLFIIP